MEYEQSPSADQGFNVSPREQHANSASVIVPFLSTESLNRPNLMSLDEKFEKLNEVAPLREKSADSEETAKQKQAIEASDTQESPKSPPSPSPPPLESQPSHNSTTSISHNEPISPRPWLETSRQCSRLAHLPRTVRWKIQWNLLALPQQFQDCNQLQEECDEEDKYKLDESFLAAFNESQIKVEYTRVDFLLERHLYNSAKQKEHEHQQHQKEREKQQQQSQQQQQQPKQPQLSSQTQSQAPDPSTTNTGVAPEQSSSSNKKGSPDEYNSAEDECRRLLSMNPVEQCERKNLSLQDAVYEEDDVGDNEEMGGILHVNFPSTEEDDDDDHTGNRDPFASWIHGKSNNSSRRTSVASYHVDFDAKAVTSEIASWEENYTNHELLDQIHKDLKRLPGRLIMWDYSPPSIPQESNNKTPKLDLVLMAEGSFHSWGDADDTSTVLSENASMTKVPSNGSVHPIQSDEPNHTDKAQQQEITSEHESSDSPEKETRRIEQVQVKKVEQDQHDVKDERICMMTDLLFGYAKEYPEIGYRQGMHEILAYVFLALDLDLSKVEKTNQVCDTPAPLLSRKNLRNDAYLLFEAWMEGLKPAYEDTNNREASELQQQGGSVQLGQRILTLTSYGSGDVFNLLNKMTEEMGAPPQLFCAKWMRLLFSREIESRIHVLEYWDALLQILYDPWHTIWNTPALQQRIASAMKTANALQSSPPKSMLGPSSKKQTVLRTLEEAKALAKSKLRLMDAMECSACSMILLQRKKLLQPLVECRHNPAGFSTKDWNRALERAVHDCLNTMMNYPSMTCIEELTIMTIRVTRFHLEHKLGMIAPRQSRNTQQPQKAPIKTLSSSSLKSLQSTQLQQQGSASNGLLVRPGNPPIASKSGSLYDVGRRRRSSAGAFQGRGGLESYKPTLAGAEEQSSPVDGTSASAFLARVGGLLAKASGGSENTASPLRQSLDRSPTNVGDIRRDSLQRAIIMNRLSSPISDPEPSSVPNSPSEASEIQQRHEKLLYQLLRLSSHMEHNLSILRDYVLLATTEETDSRTTIVQSNPPASLETMSSPNQSNGSRISLESEGFDVQTPPVGVSNSTGPSHGHKQQPPVKVLMALQQLDRAQALLAFYGSSAKSKNQVK